MNTQKTQGFTVIEVVLFLAISGLLGIGIMATAASSINQERYRDSVRSLHSYLQKQYSDVFNVQNGRGGNQFRCSQNGTVVDTTASSGIPQSRGTSECTIAGKVVDVIGDNGRIVRSQPVYATYDPMRDLTLPANDIDALKKSRLVVGPASLDNDEYSLEWQTSLANTSGGAQQFRLLIVRSPLSGMVRTYAESAATLQPSTTTTINSLLTSGTMMDITACVNPDGLFTGQKLGVRIARNAASSSGVTLLDGEVCS